MRSEGNLDEGGLTYLLPSSSCQVPLKASYNSYNQRSYSSAACRYYFLSFPAVLENLKKQEMKPN